MKEYKEVNKEYKEGFSTDVETFSLPPGLDEDVVRTISSMKNEPEWLLNFRLKAFEHWKNSVEPTWAELDYKPIDYQSISYYSAPKKLSKDEIPQEIFDTFEKLGSGICVINLLHHCKMHRLFPLAYQKPYSLFLRFLLSIPTIGAVIGSMHPANPFRIF